jgi:hypothetical protein
VADRALREHRDVGGAGADVDQRHAEFLLVRGQHRGAGRQRAEDQVVDLQMAAVDALADVLRRRQRADDQMRAHFQAHAGHPDRMADAFLRVVDDVFLRDRMQDALVGRNRDRLGRLQHALHVGVGDFAVLDRHDAGRVPALRMRAGDRGVDAADLATGHQLGLLDRALDRVARSIRCPPPRRA